MKIFKKFLIIFYFYYLLINFINASLNPNSILSPISSSLTSLKSSSKITKNVYNKLGIDLKNEISMDDQIKLWIFFNSKDYIIQQNKKNGTPNQYKEIKAITGVNDDSIKRRSKRSINKNVPIFDETDLPVSTKYINQIIDECGHSTSDDQLSISVGRTSNWLNSISISTKSESNKPFTMDQIIECISNKTYVQSIDIVSKFLNSQPGDGEIKEIKSSSSPSSNNNNNNKNPLYNNGKVKLLLNNDNPTPSFDQFFYGESYQGINQSNIDKIQKLGYDGYGIKILIMDTGFYKDHDAFKHLKIIGEHNFIDNTNNTQEPCDPTVDPRYTQNFHGTATLSVLGGYLPGKLVGAAYNASFLLAKTEIVEGEDTVIEEDNWIAALEWGEKLGASIISSSLSYQLYNYPEMNGKISHLTIAANLASSKGMVVVNSMGNKDYSIFGAPTDGENVISVGAVDKTGRYAPFSSIGPTSDGRVKPDIMGLGVNYFVALSTSSTSYTKVDGTSFACPLVASGVALLMQAHPDWNPQQIYQAVLASGSKSSQPDPYLGFGVFNALAAHNFKPSFGNCFNTGCSGNGLCCSDGQCQCVPAYYGQQCQYKRIECGYRCMYDFNEKCQINNLGPSFTCVSHNDTSSSILNQNPFSLMFCKKTNNPTTPKPSSSGNSLLKIVISI